MSESVSERKLWESAQEILVFFLVLLPSEQKRFGWTRPTRWRWTRAQQTKEKKVLKSGGYTRTIRYMFENRSKSVQHRFRTRVP